MYDLPSTRQRLILHTTYIAGLGLSLELLSSGHSIPHRILWIPSVAMKCAQTLVFSMTSNAAIAEAVCTHTGFLHQGYRLSQDRRGVCTHTEFLPTTAQFTSSNEVCTHTEFLSVAPSVR